MPFSDTLSVGVYRWSGAAKRHCQRGAASHTPPDSSAATQGGLSWTMIAAIRVRMGKAARKTVLMAAGFEQTPPAGPRRPVRSAVTSAAAHGDPVSR